jgi:pimeloyl-ACP methyl ester carboxylesterase
MFLEVTGKPILLIHGEHSDILSDAAVRKMREEKPDLAVLTVRDQGHAPFLDTPECVAAIDLFLEQLP